MRGNVVLSTTAAVCFCGTWALAEKLHVEHEQPGLASEEPKEFMSSSIRGILSETGGPDAMINESRTGQIQWNGILTRRVTIIILHIPVNSGYIFLQELGPDIGSAGSTGRSEHPYQLGTSGWVKLIDIWGTDLWGEKEEDE
ncbi:hypothetical protein B0H13DRAFT_2514933 [Mycena leptocephala]|nr:hypothetical protein B0H13DRAFT_2514933 [Mycena leptocephala]